MAAQLFTVLNNGSTNYNITSIVFNTPAGIQHTADLTNFGGSSSFTGATFTGSSALNIGQSKTFTVDHEYVSGPENTRTGTIVINTDGGPIATINTTIAVGTAGASLGASLPGQGIYTASRTNITNGESFITLSLTSNGTLQVDCVDGLDFTGAWITPWPSSGIGEFYWVRFTRQSSTGVGNYQSTPTTGWLQLNSFRSVTVSAFGLANGLPSSASVQYLIEVSSSSGGSPIIASGTYTLVPSGTLGGIVNPLDTIEVTAFDFEFARASVTFFRSGAINKFESQNDITVLSPWFLNGSSTVGDNYYIRATIASGQLPSGPAFNTWHSLSTNRTWFLVSTENFERTSTFNIEISLTPDTSGIVSSGYVLMDALSYLNGIPGGGFDVGDVIGRGGSSTGDGYVYISSPSTPTDISGPPDLWIDPITGDEYYIYPDGTVIKYPASDILRSGTTNDRELLVEQDDGSVYVFGSDGRLIQTYAPPGDTGDETDRLIGRYPPPVDGSPGDQERADQLGGAPPAETPTNPYDDGSPGPGGINPPINPGVESTPVDPGVFDAPPSGPDIDPETGEPAIPNIGDEAEYNPTPDPTVPDYSEDGGTPIEGTPVIVPGEGPSQGDPFEDVGPGDREEGTNFGETGDIGSGGSFSDSGQSDSGQSDSGFDTVDSIDVGYDFGCPDPSMNILLHDGQLIPANDLKKGMLLKTKHSTTFEWGNFEVVNAVKIIQPKMQIVFDNTVVICSTTHRFHIKNDEWKFALQLKVGDKINGKSVRSIKTIGLGPVIKITVAIAQTYIVEGFLSHNVKDTGGGVGDAGGTSGGGGGGTLEELMDVDSV